MKESVLISNLCKEAESAAYPLPWEYDSNCYNFRCPEAVIRNADFDGINRAAVRTLVIDCELRDYGFLSELPELRQLYIYTGRRISELSFLQGLLHLKQLVLADTQISSLEPLLALAAAKKSAEPPNSAAMDCICISSENELDAGRLLSAGLCRSELIVNGKRLL